MFSPTQSVPTPSTVHIYEILSSISSSCIVCHILFCSFFCRHWSFFGVALLIQIAFVLYKCFICLPFLFLEVKEGVFSSPRYLVLDLISFFFVEGLSSMSVVIVSQSASHSFTWVKLEHCISYNSAPLTF